MVDCGCRMILKVLYGPPCLTVDRAVYTMSWQNLVDHLLQHVQINCCLSNPLRFTRSKSISARPSQREHVSQSTSAFPFRCGFNVNFLSHPDTCLTRCHWFTLLHSFTDSDGLTVFDGCGITELDGIEYAYYYPEEDTYQYLYETFPDVRWPNRTALYYALHVLCIVQTRWT